MLQRVLLSQQNLTFSYAAEGANCLTKILQFCFPKNYLELARLDDEEKNIGKINLSQATGHLDCVFFSHNYVFKKY